MRKYILVLLCLLFSNVAQELKAQKQPDTLILGGAFRYTYMKNSWNSDHKKTGGKAIFDAFIMNAKESYNGINVLI